MLSHDFFPISSDYQLRQIVPANRDKHCRCCREVSFSAWRWANNQPTPPKPNSAGADWRRSSQPPPCFHWLPNVWMLSPPFAFVRLENPSVRVFLRLLFVEIHRTGIQHRSHCSLWCFQNSWNERTGRRRGTHKVSNKLCPHSIVQLQWLLGVRDWLGSWWTKRRNI